MPVFIRGNKVNVDPSKSIGKGGEADVYLISSDTVLKIYKTPDHPDYSAMPFEQEGARRRIEEHQEKLPAFPKNLPARVIVPADLATDQARKGKIVGYTMRFLDGAEVLRRYSERSFRQSGVGANDVVAIFRDLCVSVRTLHQSHVVVGDFNDLNVLVRGLESYLIDADSFQFGKFRTAMFTMRFVDPILCDPTASKPMLAKPHNTDSDWYAFRVLLMQSLLYVDPYGGVYRPGNPSDRIPHDQRPMKRITVFHPEVRYPKPAIPYKVLPDELLEQFHRAFEKDERGAFPEAILQNLRWTICTTCGTEHARAMCPECLAVAPAAIKEKTVVRGSVTATRIFRTDGVILHATLQHGKLLWLVHDRGEYRREDGLVVTRGELDPRTRYRIRGKETLLGRGDQVVTVATGAVTTRLAVDAYGTLPLFDTNERARFWSHNGQLLRDGDIGPEYIGDVLAGQTLFWVGPTFGFGLYRAGELSVAFVFDANRRGINDTVKMPRISGHLLDSVCCFTKELCWFFYSTQREGRTINRCMIVKPDGKIESQAEGEAGDGGWLSTIRGKCASGNFLLAATDEGIVRVEPSGATISAVKEFPDTEPFVHHGCHIFPGRDGLYVVDGKEISILKIG